MNDIFGWNRNDFKIFRIHKYFRNSDKFRNISTFPKSIDGIRYASFQINAFQIHIFNFSIFEKRKKTLCYLKFFVKMIFCWFLLKRPSEPSEQKQNKNVTKQNQNKHDSYEWKRRKRERKENDNNNKMQLTKDRTVSVPSRDVSRKIYTEWEKSLFGTHIDCFCTHKHQSSSLRTESERRSEKWLKGGSWTLNVQGKKKNKKNIKKINKHEIHRIIQYNMLSSHTNIPIWDLFCSISSRTPYTIHSVGSVFHENIPSFSTSIPTFNIFSFGLKCWIFVFLPFGLSFEKSSEKSFIIQIMSIWNGCPLVLVCFVSF